MTDKPTTADGYPPELAAEAKRMCPLRYPRLPESP